MDRESLVWDSRPEKVRLNYQPLISLIDCMQILLTECIIMIILVVF